MAIKEVKNYFSGSGVELSGLTDKQAHAAIMYLTGLKLENNKDNVLGRLCFFEGTKCEKEGKTNYIIIYINNNWSRYNDTCVDEYNEYTGKTILDMYIKFREADKKFWKAVDEVKKLIEQF